MACLRLGTSFYVLLGRSLLTCSELAKYCGKRSIAVPIGFSFQVHAVLTAFVCGV